MDKFIEFKETIINLAEVLYVGAPVKNTEVRDKYQYVKEYRHSITTTIEFQSYTSSLVHSTHWLEKVDQQAYDWTEMEKDHKDERAVFMKELMDHRNIQ